MWPFAARKTSSSTVQHILTLPDLSYAADASSSPITKLPSDLILEVADFVGPADIVRCMTLVCRGWAMILEFSDSWRVLLASLHPVFERVAVRRFVATAKELGFDEVLPQIPWKSEALSALRLLRSDSSRPMARVDDWPDAAGRSTWTHRPEGWTRPVGEFVHSVNLLTNFMPRSQAPTLMLASVAGARLPVMARLRRSAVSAWRVLFPPSVLVLGSGSDEEFRRLHDLHAPGATTESSMMCRFFWCRKIQLMTTDLTPERFMTTVACVMLTARYKTGAALHHEVRFTLMKVKRLTPIVVNLIAAAPAEAVQVANILEDLCLPAHGDTRGRPWMVHCGVLTDREAELKRSGRMLDWLYSVAVDEPPL